MSFDSRKNYEIYKSLIIIFSLTFFLIFSTGCKSSKKASSGSKKDKVELVNRDERKNLKGIRKKIVDEAMTWVGTPYRYGGSDKRKGSDCSGLVIRVYEDVAGIKLPRNSRQQSEYCEKVSRGKVKPGDLVFFATGKSKNVVSHVGIVIDSERFVHSSTQKGVIVSDLDAPYYQRTFMMFGTVSGLERK